MLTQSTERFIKIQSEAPVDCQKFLVQVTKYQAAKHCKVKNIPAKIFSKASSFSPSVGKFSHYLLFWQGSYAGKEINVLRRANYDWMYSNVDRRG